MSVYGWIYANAKRKGDSGDYQVRFCAPQMKDCQTLLISLSRCMLSTTKRYGEAEKKLCWFSGFLDKKKQLFVVAVAGEQEELLGISLAGGGFRRQYGVLALGFDGDDIALYRRTLRIFEPLAAVLRRIQQTEGRGTAEGPMAEQDYAAYREVIPAAGNAAEKCDILPSAAGTSEECNIVPSTEDGDAVLWRISLSRPVMTGILSEADAKKLLGMFPDGIVTVAGEQKPQHYAALKLSEADRKKLRESGILIGAGQTTGAKSSAARVRKVKPTARYAADGKALHQGNVISTAADVAEELRKTRYGKIRRRKIRECAERCKRELRPREVAAAEAAVKKTKRTGEAAEQLFYFCCMQLWLLGQEGKRMPGEKEILALLKAREEQIGEKKLIQTNCMMRRTVQKLRGEEDDL